MGNVFAFLQLLAGIAERILRDGSVEIVQAMRAIMFRISLAARMAIAWPFVLLIAALPAGKYWPTHYIVLVITISILLAFLWMATGMGPLGVLVAESMLSPETSYIGKFVETARKATNALRIILFFELTAGIYFAWVPVSNNRALALTQILIIAAIVCVVGIKGWKPIVATLGVIFLGITLAFFFCRSANAAGSKSDSGISAPLLAINLNVDRQVEAKTDGRTEKFPKGRSAAKTPQAPPQRETGSAGDSGNSTDSPARKPAPLAPRPLPTIYPLSGDKGNIVPIMHDCYYSSGDVVTCEGSVLNMDSDRVKHGIYLMDSQGIAGTRDGRGEQFSVWTFGGSLRFSGEGDFFQVIPDMPAPFVFSFRENTGQAERVGITLSIKSAADSINHEYAFANVPVLDRRP